MRRLERLRLQDEFNQQQDLLRAQQELQHLMEMQEVDAKWEQQQQQQNMGTDEHHRDTAPQGSAEVDQKQQHHHQETGTQHQSRTEQQRAKPMNQPEEEQQHAKKQEFTGTTQVTDATQEHKRESEHTTPEHMETREPAADTDTQRAQDDRERDSAGEHMPPGQSHSTDATALHVDTASARDTNTWEDTNPVLGVPLFLML